MYITQKTEYGDKNIIKHEFHVGSENGMHFVQRHH